MSEQKNSRRDFLKKLGYTAPVILTFKAAPAFAKLGSLRCKVGEGHGKPDFFNRPPRGLADKLKGRHDFRRYGGNGKHGR